MTSPQNCESFLYLIFDRIGRGRGSVCATGDLKAEGAIDYFALPVKSALGTNYTVTYATDRLADSPHRQLTQRADLRAIRYSWASRRSRSS